MSTGASPTMSNFPGGFANGLSVRGMPLLQMQPGQVFFLGNGAVTISGARTGSDNNRGTFLSPFGTLQGALNSGGLGTISYGPSLTANQGVNDGRGDIIFVLPGHREVISSNTALLLNQNGVAIIGLGSGHLRPTFILDTATTATINVRAAGMSIQNCLFLANFGAIASCFTIQSGTFTASIAGSVMTVTAGTVYNGCNISGAGIVPGTCVITQLTGTANGVGTYLLNEPATFASGTITAIVSDFAIDNCEFRDLSSTLNFVSLVTGNATTNTMDGFQFTRNRVTGLGTTAGTTLITPLAATDRMQLNSNFVNQAVLNNTPILLAGGSFNHTNLEIGWNILNRPNTSSTGGLMMSSTSTACTGHVHDNQIWSLTSTPVIAPTGTKLAFDQNFANNTGAADKSGLLLPAAV